MGKNIRMVILFEWVILFEKPILIGNYIHRVNIIKGSLYSRVYDIPPNVKSVPIHIYGKYNERVYKNSWMPLSNFSPVREAILIQRFNYTLVIFIRLHSDQVSHCIPRQYNDVLETYVCLLD